MKSIWVWWGFLTCTNLYSLIYSMCVFFLENKVCMPTRVSETAVDVFKYLDRVVEYQIWLIPLLIIFWPFRRKKQTSQNLSGSYRSTTTADISGTYNKESIAGYYKHTTQEDDYNQDFSGSDVSGTISESGSILKGQPGWESTANMAYATFGQANVSASNLGVRRLKDNSLTSVDDFTYQDNIMMSSENGSVVYKSGLVRSITLNDVETISNEGNTDSLLNTTGGNDHFGSIPRSTSTKMKKSQKELYL